SERRQGTSRRLPAWGARDEQSDIAGGLEAPGVAHVGIDVLQGLRPGTENGGKYTFSHGAECRTARGCLACGVENARSAVWAVLCARAERRHSGRGILP